MNIFDINWTENITLDLCHARRIRQYRVVDERFDIVKQDPWCAVDALIQKPLWCAGPLSGCAG